MRIDIKNFGTDLKIIHIGNLFKYLNNSEWYLTVWCQPKQEKTWTRLANLPLIRRGKTINPTGLNASTDNHRIISFTDLYKMSHTTLAEFIGPEANQSYVQKQESLQHAFNLCTPHENNIIIPQLELARALFLWNSYLCHSCLSSTTLTLDFDIQTNQMNSEVNIHILKTSTFPLEALNEEGTLSVLAWMLVSPSAMTSFNSIYQHYIEKHEPLSNGEKWNFSFEAPDMHNWQLSVRGRYNHSKTHYLVEEIMGLVINTKMPTSITFHHPEFIKSEFKKSHVSQENNNATPHLLNSDYEIDDEQSASDTYKTISQGDSSWARFLNPFKVQKQEKIKNRVSPHIEKDSSDSMNSYPVSTAEPHNGGDLPSFSVGGKQSQNELNQQYANRFEAFNSMIDILITKYNCVLIKQETIPLPKTGRSKSHLLNNGSSRFIKAAYIGHQSNQFILLEIDTSDGIKMLSTKIITNQKPDTWPSHFQHLRKAIVAHSISWPNKVLDGSIGYDMHHSINHPQCLYGIADKLPIDSLNSWAIRVIEKFNILTLKI